MFSIQSVPGQIPAARLQADAPLLGIAGRSGTSLGVEFVPCLGRIARPVLGVVPDQALHGALGEDAGQLAVCRLAERSEAGWRRARRLVRREIDEVRA